MMLKQMRLKQMRLKLLLKEMDLQKEQKEMQHRQRKKQWTKGSKRAPRAPRARERSPGGPRPAGRARALTNRAVEDVKAKEKAFLTIGGANTAGVDIALSTASSTRSSAIVLVVCDQNCFLS